MHDAVANAIFRAIDTDCSGMLEEDEFHDAILMIPLATVQSKKLLDAAHKPRSACEAASKLVSRFLRTMFGQRMRSCCGDVCIADAVVDLLVIVSIVQVYMSAQLRVEGDAADGAKARAWHTLGLALLSIFVVEICLRIWAHGYQAYLRSSMHRLDVACAVIGAVFFCLDKFIASGASGLYNFALVLRTLRIFRLLWLNKQWHGMLWTVAQLLPSLTRLFTIMIIPMYMLASFGAQFFGTCLVAGARGGPHTSAQGNASIAAWAPFDDVLQFDSTGRALLGMFEITTIAKWFIIMDAATALCGQASPFFFYVARVVLTMIYLPILTGFIIEGFVKQFQTYSESQAAISEHEEQAESIAAQDGMSTSATIQHVSGSGSEEITIRLGKKKQDLDANILNESEDRRRQELDMLRAQATEMQKRISGLEQSVRESRRAELQLRRANNKLQIKADAMKKELQRRPRK